MIKFLPKVPSLPLHNLDITSWDLSRLDPRQVLRRPDLAATIGDSPVGRVAGRTATQARDIALTAVGFGVLASQKLQVRRRELFDAISARRQSAEPASADATPVADA